MTSAGFFAGDCLPSSITPNPLFIRRGFDLIPKPLSPLQGRGLVDYGQRPPCVKVLVWLSSLCPYGIRHDFLHSPQPLPGRKGRRAAMRQPCASVSPFSRGGDSWDVKTLSRVPRYQNGEKSAVSATFRVASPFEGGLGGSAPLLVRFLGASEKMNK
jgi:hypothetical protein